MGTTPPSPRDSALSSFLVAALESVKALHAMVASVTTELVAIRRTFLEQPERMREYEKQLNDAIATAKPLTVAAIKSYDEMIARVKELNEWKN